MRLSILAVSVGLLLGPVGCGADSSEPGSTPLAPVDPLEDASTVLDAGTDVSAGLQDVAAQDDTAMDDAGAEPTPDTTQISDTAAGPDGDVVEEPADDAGVEPEPADASVSDVPVADAGVQDAGPSDASADVPTGDPNQDPFEATLETCGAEECPSELAVCMADEICSAFLACVGSCEEENTPVCGDGECEGMMEQFMCSEDCGEGGGMPGGGGGGWEMPECGDGECGWGESFEDCPEDCDEPECGDGQCNGDETEETCSEDCDGSDSGGMGGGMDDMMPKVVADCAQTCSESLGVAPQSFDALFFCAEEADCMNPMSGMMGGGGMPFP